MAQPNASIVSWPNSNKIRNLAFLKERQWSNSIGQGMMEAMPAFTLIHQSSQPEAKLD
jgi:hypothetical protein